MRVLLPLAQNNGKEDEKAAATEETQGIEINTPLDFEIFAESEEHTLQQALITPTSPPRTEESGSPPTETEANRKRPARTETTPVVAAHSKKTRVAAKKPPPSQPNDNFVAYSSQIALDPT